MEEKRKKFGMELLPSLHRRLKQRALDTNRQLWSVVQEAIQQYLDGPLAPGDGDVDLDRARYVLEHGREDRVSAFRGSIDLYYGDAQQHPRSGKAKRRAG